MGRDALERKLPRVGISLGVTLNIGNFESVRADAHFSVDVEPGVEYDDAWAGALAETQVGLRTALDGIREMLKKRADFQVGLDTTKTPRR